MKPDSVEDIQRERENLPAESILRFHTKADTWFLV